VERLREKKIVIFDFLCVIEGDFMVGFILGMHEFLHGKIVDFLKRFREFLQFFGGYPLNLVII